MSDPSQIARETKPRPDTPRHTVAALWHLSQASAFDLTPACPMRFFIVIVSEQTLPGALTQI